MKVKLKENSRDMPQIILNKMNLGFSLADSSHGHVRPGKINNNAELDNERQDGFLVHQKSSGSRYKIFLLL